MADLERFDADPDPLFKLMRIRIQIFVRKGNNKCSNLHFFHLHNLTKLVMCNFLSNNSGGGARGEGLGVKDEAMRGEG